MGIKRLVFLVFSILILKMYSQNDTIYLSDTIISSVRIMNHDENNLNYFSLDNNNKKISSVSLDLILTLNFLPQILSLVIPKDTRSIFPL